MALTPEEKAERARQRMIDKAKEFQIGTYVNRFVAPEFQQMIRAEYASRPGRGMLAIVDGKPQRVSRRLGYCVCVTCGKVAPWKSGLGGMHCGHFLASRCFSILFEEDNVAPQCSGCNRYHSGRPQEFRLWMEHVRGLEVVERLQQLKATSRHFTREELVDMRIEYKRRLSEAVERMTNSH